MADPNFIKGGSAELMNCNFTGDRSADRIQWISPPVVAFPRSSPRSSRRPVGQRESSNHACRRVTRAHSSDPATMRQVLRSMDAGEQFCLGRVVVASLLNADQSWALVPGHYAHDHRDVQRDLLGRRVIRWPRESWGRGHVPRYPVPREPLPGLGVSAKLRRAGRRVLRMLRGNRITAAHAEAIIFANAGTLGNVHDASLADHAPCRTGGSQMGQRVCRAPCAVQRHVPAICDRRADSDRNHGRRHRATPTTSQRLPGGRRRGRRSAVSALAELGFITQC